MRNPTTKMAAKEAQISETNEEKPVHFESKGEAGGGDGHLSDSHHEKENETDVDEPQRSSDPAAADGGKPKREFRRFISGSGSDGQEPSGSDSSPLSTSSSRETLNCTELYLASMLKKTNIYSTEAVPLHNPWTFWVEKSKRGVAVEEFEANLRKIYTVYTVHLFWGVFYNIPLPSTLHIRSSLHMTRDEKKPIWEESYNRNGGTFRMRVNKRDTDKVWRELLMAAVGEQLNEYVGPNDEIFGLSVSSREREDLVLIWNKNASDARVARVFECVHLLLPDTVFISEFYKPHVEHISYDRHKDITAHHSKSNLSNTNR